MTTKLTGLLPKPVHKTLDELEKEGLAHEDDDDGDDDDALEQAYRSGAGKAGGAGAQRPPVPAYGKRKGWVPRDRADFGDGGAYPEVPLAQYPRGMGKKEQERDSKQIVALQVDEDGKVKYDAILRQGAQKDRTIFSSYKDLVPVQIKDNDPLRDLPDDEAVQATTEKTKAALEKIVDGALVNTKATHVNLVDSKAQFVRYTPALPGQAHAVSEQRIIRMVELQQDPMEPPKFKTNKKLPRGPPSPPAPVLHSPPRKVSVAEQNDWKIPPSISNWKNQKGFTIPLDKRMAADGRGLQDTQVNENFAKFAEALYVVERVSRETIALRQEVAKKAAMKEKEKQEEEFRLLAQRAREERAGIRPPKDAEVEERDEIREDRRRERERQHRIDRAGHDTKTRLTRDRDRDVSERVALGLPVANTGGSGVQFDSRLYNQSQGLSAGFADEEAYAVYDKAFRSEQSTSIYRPTKTKGDIEPEEYERLKSTDRFRPDKGFSGTDGKRQDGPVQFEKQDDLGLTDFLNQAKSESKGKRSRGDDDDEDDSRGRSRR